MRKHMCVNVAEHNFMAFTKPVTPPDPYRRQARFDPWAECLSSNAGVVTWNHPLSLPRCLHAHTHGAQCPRSLVQTLRPLHSFSIITARKSTLAKKILGYYPCAKYTIENTPFPVLRLSFRSWAARSPCFFMRRGWNITSPMNSAPGESPITSGTGRALPSLRHQSLARFMRHR